MPRIPSIKIEDLQPGAKVAGYVHSCGNCETLFIASADAIYCCNACRMAAARKTE